ncbi:MAG: hypothetical protein RB296_04725 [Acidobacteriota bacterium]|jgi:hypothetical protein|nr:hypothetical protein [Acidobacteriota bacterium]
MKMDKLHSPLQKALHFLSQDISGWMVYLAVRGLLVLLTSAVIFLLMMGARSGPNGWLYAMLILPLPAYCLSRQVLSRREWRWISIFLAGEPIPMPKRGTCVAAGWRSRLAFLEAECPSLQSTPQKNHLIRLWRLQRLAVELLIMAPFLLTALALAWNAPRPLLAYVVLSAIVVGGGFAAGAVAPVFILILVARVFPAARS